MTLTMNDNHEKEDNDEDDNKIDNKEELDSLEKKRRRVTVCVPDRRLVRPSKKRSCVSYSHGSCMQLLKNLGICVCVFNFLLLSYLGADPISHPE